MLEQIRSIFFEYANIILLVPLFLAGAQRRRSAPELKIVFYYLLLSLITQILSFIFWKRNTNNYPILHVYTVIEYLLLLWFYATVLKNFIPIQVFFVLALIFPFFSIFNSIFIEKIYFFNTYARSVEALIFIVLGIAWFVKIVDKDDTQRQMAIPVNYINSGLLIYFSGSIAMFAYSSYVEQMTEYHRVNVWTIHTVLVVLQYLLIAFGLWRMKTK